MLLTNKYLKQKITSHYQNIYWQNTLTTCNVCKLLSSKTGTRTKIAFHRECSRSNFIFFHMLEQLLLVSTLALCVFFLQAFGYAIKNKTSLYIKVVISTNQRIINNNTSSVIRQKGESQNECFKKVKYAKISEKQTFLTS